MMADSMVSAALRKMGMVALEENFKKEKIEASMVSALTDTELSRLGLTTIGTRHLFRKAVSELSAPNRNLHEQIRHERSVLFQCASTRSRIGTKKKSEKTWTMQFLCLSDKNQQRAPSSSEKEILNKAGLGLKKVLLNKTDDEKEVIEKLMSEERNSDGQTKGFPQLKSAGGFELLRCTQNHKTLSLINCSWSAKDLRKNVNCQTNIYIRPIQKSLSTIPLEDEHDGENVKTLCTTCQCEFPVRELREHVEMCQPPSVIYEVVVEEPVAVTTESTEASVQPHNSPVTSDHVLSENVHMDVGTPLQDVDWALPEVAIHVAPNEASEEIQSHMDNQSASNGFGAIFEIQSPVEKSAHDVAGSVVNFCKEHGVSEPIEILRILQKEMVTGRPLDIDSVSECSDGDTNLIFITRVDILSSAFDEIGVIMDKDLRQTLEVQFCGEEAQDYGGPRKEFFRECLYAIKEKYFDHGLREHLSTDYELIALSILQNGNIPKFLSPEILQELFETQEPSDCIAHLRQGLDALGILQVCKQLESFRFLFHPSSVQLNPRKLCALLKPEFSDEGSNAYIREQKVYSCFIRYMREVAGGRREKVALSNILAFATGADEEPPLGFRIHPAMKFPDWVDSYLPTANTCINLMYLPKAPALVELPKDEEIFKFYDYAFTNNFYGLR